MEINWFFNGKSNVYYIFIGRSLSRSQVTAEIVFFFLGHKLKYPQFLFRSDFSFMFEERALFTRKKY